MELKVQDKEVVVPGQILSTGMEYLPAAGTYRLGDDIRANRVGLIKIDGKVIKTIPMAGVYIPHRNDIVIGRIVDILMSGWRLDINSPYSSVLQIKDATFDFITKGADLTKYFDLEDYAVIKIIQVTTQNLVDVTCKGTGLRKLAGGRIIKVSPSKVPRIIGTKGSMISMVKKATGCKIIVGQNGVIWMEGSPEKEHIAVKIISLIEELAHTSGLTDKIKQKLVELTGVTAEELESLPVEDEFADNDRYNDRRSGNRGERGEYNRDRRSSYTNRDRRPSYGNRDGNRRPSFGRDRDNNRPPRDKPRFEHKNNNDQVNQ